MNIPRARQDLLELVADYAEYCVLVTTAELNEPGPQILYVNSAFTCMTGYSVQDLLGKSPRILQGPDTDRPMLARLRETLEAGKDFIARTINYRKNGEPFEIEWIISHLRDATGRTTHYIAVQRDITDMHRAKDDLLKYDDELRDARTRILADAEHLRQAEMALEQKRKVALLGEMAAGVVHDISNALTPVFGLVQILHTMDNLPRQARQLSESMDSSIEHALQVLSNLKRYYQNPQYNDPMPIDLIKLVNRLSDVTSANWRGQAPSGKYVFSISADSGVLTRGNEIELLQVFVNIVLNALQAMPDGGTINVNLHAEDTMAVLSIADTGPGMDPDMAASCFEPYVTGRSTGAGLGLAVCRRIIEAHGGHIQLQNDASTGTNFTIRLPLLVPDNESTSDLVKEELVAGGSSCELQR